MKKNITIIGILLVFLIAGEGCHSFRHDRRDMKDWGRMARMRMEQHFMHNRGMHGRYGMGPGMMSGMGYGMGQGMRSMGRGMGFGMRGGMNRMPMDSLGWRSMGAGRRILESIPNVTENQKKQIEDLMKKQNDDMKKLREEMSSKMQNLMDSHKKDMLNILTDEQKKFVDAGREKTFPWHEDGK